MQFKEYLTPTFLFKDRIESDTFYPITKENLEAIIEPMDDDENGVFNQSTGYFDWKYDKVRVSISPSILECDTKINKMISEYLTKNNITIAISYFRSSLGLSVNTSEEVIKTNVNKRVADLSGYFNNYVDLYTGIDSSNVIVKYFVDSHAIYDSAYKYLRPETQPNMNDSFYSVLTRRDRAKLNDYIDTLVTMCHKLLEAKLLEISKGISNEVKS